MIDLTADFVCLLPITIIADLLVIPKSERLMFKEWVDVLIDTHITNHKRNLIESKYP